MHEYPITEHIVDICSQQCREAEASRVSAINIVIGDYSGYVSESIEMYFDIIAEGTPCEGAALNFTKIKPKLKCDKCGHLFEKRPMTFDCPMCGGQGGPTDIGKEFFIENIEVE